MKHQEDFGRVENFLDRLDLLSSFVVKVFYLH